MGHKSFFRTRSRLYRVYSPALISEPSEYFHQEPGYAGMYSEGKIVSISTCGSMGSSFLLHELKRSRASSKQRIEDGSQTSFFIARRV